MALCHALSGLNVMNRTQRRRARPPPGSPVGSCVPELPGPRKMTGPTCPTWLSSQAWPGVPEAGHRWGKCKPAPGLGREGALGIRTGSREKRPAGLWGQAWGQVFGLSACHQCLSWSRRGSQGGFPRPQSHARSTDMTQQTLLPPHEAILLALRVQDRGEA